MSLVRGGVSFVGATLEPVPPGSRFFGCRNAKKWFRNSEVALDLSWSKRPSEQTDLKETTVWLFTNYLRSRVGEKNRFSEISQYFAQRYFINSNAPNIWLLA